MPDFDLEAAANTQSQPTTTYEPTTTSNNTTPNNRHPQSKSWLVALDNGATKVFRIIAYIFTEVLPALILLGHAIAVAVMVYVKPYGWWCSSGPSGYYVITILICAAFIFIERCLDSLDDRRAAYAIAICVASGFGSFYMSWSDIPCRAIKI